MTVIDDLTPVYFKLVRIGLQRDGTTVRAIADLHILNENGEQLAIRTPSTVLTPAETAALAGFVNREMGAYAAATGLTEWEEIDD